MKRSIALVLNALVDGPLHCDKDCPHSQPEKAKEKEGYCRLFDKALLQSVSKKKTINLRCRECRDHEA